MHEDCIDIKYIKLNTQKLRLYLLKNSRIICNCGDINASIRHYRTPKFKRISLNLNSCKFNLINTMFSWIKDCIKFFIKNSSFRYYTSSYEHKNEPF